MKTNMPKFTLDVKATLSSNGDINIETSDFMSETTRKCIHTEEEVVKKFLIQRGWTPPIEKSMKERILRVCNDNTPAQNRIDFVIHTLEKL